MLGETFIGNKQAGWSRAHSCPNSTQLVYGSQRGGSVEGDAALMEKGHCPPSSPFLDFLGEMPGGGRWWWCLGW